MRASPINRQKPTTVDPFRSLPEEVRLEVVNYLGYSDIRSCQSASVVWNQVTFRSIQYRRFFFEEMCFLPGLIMDTERREREGRITLHDWQPLFDHVAHVWRHDARLRNRRRIWKIVQPMAEELVERSSPHFRVLGGLSQAVASAITVVRGNVGVRSGVQGGHETVVFSELFRPVFELPGGANSTPSGVRSDTAAARASSADLAVPQECFHAMRRIDLWLHPTERYICGMQFVFISQRMAPEPNRIISKQLGSRTVLCKSFMLDGHARVLTGFRVSWRQGRLWGIQFVLDHNQTPPTEYCDAETITSWYGRDDGPVRRLVAPRKFRALAGVTAFIASSGFIETFAILEKKKPLVGVGRLVLLMPPDTVPMSHREGSLWQAPPPNDVEVLERLGAYLDDWRIRMAQCEVFAPTSQYQPPGEIYSVVLFCDEQFLVGIRFLYQGGTGRLHRDIGNCEGGTGVKVLLQAGEEVALAVIGHGKDGVYSMQVCLLPVPLIESF